MSDALPESGSFADRAQTDSPRAQAPSSIGGKLSDDVEFPSSVPPQANVASNIREAESRKGNFLWFYSRVHNGGPWDYKQLNKEYEAFGNFNFGATGAAAGFSEATLLRVAGWANVRAGNTLPEWGQSVTLMQALLGIGGVAPFGDDPKDQRWISSGVRYYDTLRRKKDGR